MRSFVVCLILVTASSLFLLPAAGLAQEKVEVQVVKHSGLANTIKQLKGRVIVVDFWAEW